MTYHRWTKLSLLALILTVTALKSFQAIQDADAKTLSVTFSHGTVRATIPYGALHQGTGLLTVEVLDPDDAVVGRAERRVEAGKTTGVWEESVDLTKPLGLEDLAWHRLRYRFTFNGDNKPS